MAAGVVKVTVLTILACSSWLSHGSLDTSPDVSTCVGKGECASKSGDAWLQTKKTDSGLSGEMWLGSGPVKIYVGEGLCQEVRFSWGLPYGYYFDYYNFYKDENGEVQYHAKSKKYVGGDVYISPPSQEFSIGAEECFEKAKDSGALGFATTQGPASYIPDEVDEYCHIYYEENLPDPSAKEGAVKRYGFLYRFGTPEADHHVPGPYKIDTSSSNPDPDSWLQPSFYAYSSCFKIEPGDYYKLTEGVSTCNEVEGYEYIPSKEECQKAAGNLGLSLEVRVRSDKFNPKGCFLAGTKKKFGPGALRWNDDGHLSFTRPRRSVICKRSD